MRQIDIDQLASTLATAPGAGATLVDVREVSEFADGHVPGAVNIPMGRLPMRSSEIDRTRPVYVICRSGNRSSAMVDLLTAQGFEAVNVAGGTQAWIAAGRPVEKN
ncbi:MAG: rhodanese-like domain-containing protein [Nocardioides sp.]|nr:rhodanese-like domain-containing protein [Nocardioides sp.]